MTVRRSRHAPPVALVLALAVGLLATAAVAQPAPRFEDFPAARFTGPRAPLRLTPDVWDYRTRFRRAARGRPDFAGHYVLGLWGCGASCTMGGAIDAATGRAVPLPVTICCETSGRSYPFPDRVQYRADSRLLILIGLRDDRQGDQGTHYYRIERGRFVHLLDVPLAPQQ